MTKPTFTLWKLVVPRCVEFIPDKFRTPLAALGTVAVILIGTFVSKETADNTRGSRGVSFFGLVVFLSALWATSRNRKKIVWHTVIVGMLAQFVIALFVLRTKTGYDIFNFISGLARDLLGFASDGVTFLTDKRIASQPWFLVSVLPAIVFFVSLVQLLYYFHILQWLVENVATFFFWIMRVSGAEAVVAAASPFVGQGESAMLIRPFITHMTMAEIHQVMCSGYATIAGSVLVSYISLGVNPQALVSSCVMSIAASLAVSKLRWPEEEETLTSGRVVIPDDDEHRPSNALDAFSHGTWIGVKIAGRIGATLLCIISLISLCDALLTWWGHYININHPPLTTVEIVSYICYPISFLLGVSREGDDIYKAAKLIGLKIISVRQKAN